LGLFFCFLSFTEQLSLCKWVRGVLWYMVVVLWCGASWARLTMVWSFSLSLSSVVELQLGLYTSFLFWICGGWRFNSQPVSCKTFAIMIS
jgi:hypothetical protein